MLSYISLKVYTNFGTLLYFSSGNIDKILYQMDLKKDKISKLKLKEINPQQILPYKNKLFVTHCDLISGM